MLLWEDGNEATLDTRGVDSEDPDITRDPMAASTQAGDR
jgi:hypothetical protein